MSAAHKTPLTLRHGRSNMVAVSLSLMAMTSAHADNAPIKPGLWDIHTDYQSTNGQVALDTSAQMAEQVSKMAPADRKQMDAQLKAQGLQVVPVNGRMSVRMCISQAMLPPKAWQIAEKNCQNAALNQSGKTWSWKFSCTQPAREGERSTTFLSPDTFANELHMTTKQDGHTIVTVMKHSGKWLNASCGDLKPFADVVKP